MMIRTHQSRADAVFAALRSALPQDAVVAGSEIEQRFRGDWMVKRPDVSMAALVLPRTTRDVSEAMRICHAHRIPVVPQGGRTGLVGGAAPDDRCVILALERMHRIGEVDGDSSTVAVEAGALLEAVQRAAEASGLFFPLDFGARGSCTIGGNIATNAGGNRVLRYGMMRELVLGLEVVLADGTIISSLAPMLKNNSGYDLKQLFVGSEGTLGIVTRAVLRLFPKPVSEQVALCAVEDYGAAIKLLTLARTRLGSMLSAYEVMWPTFYRLGTEALGRAAPLPHGHGAYILVEATGFDEGADAVGFMAFVEQGVEDGLIVDAVIAQSQQQVRDLWAIRDSSGEFPKTFWPYTGFDVSFEIPRISAFIEECERRLLEKLPTAETAWFGHIADGNIHIAVRIPGADDQPEQVIDEIVYDCVADFGGAVSAEHGIGLLKLPYLDRTRSPAEIAAMRAIKQAFDPIGTLNPGKVLALTGALGSPAKSVASYL